MTNLRDSLESDTRRVLVHLPDVNDAEAMAAFATAVRGFLAEHQISQSQLARRIGSSATAINHLLGNKYTGDVAGLVERVGCYVNAEFRRLRRAVGPDFVEITVAQKIRSLVARVESFSDTEARIGVIIGDAGCGKSACLRAYAEADAACIYVSHDSASRVSGLLSAITRAVTGLGSDGELTTVTHRLVEAMSLRRYLVLIDEASSLRAKDLDRLRSVLCVKCRSPLILAGNNDLLRSIQANSDKAGYASLDQFNSRLMGILNLDELAVGGDDGPLYSADDIRRLYEYGGIRLTGDAVDVLGRICRTPRSGKLRTCRDVIRALHSATQVQESGTITGDLVWQAIVQLRLPVAEWLPTVCQDRPAPFRKAAMA
ncbi:MAG: AAA family ATPase [Phycisphaerae bacterium]|nr:AAA family ATPase [Phycisphaerae bacterium]